MKTADLIIKARWLIPVDDQNQVLEHASLVVTDGTITAIGPHSDISKQFTASETLNFNHHIIMPGLVNAHTHLPMSLLRGLADDLPLMTWLNDYIWPAEQKNVCANFASLGATLAICELIRSGVTCFNDMYFYGQSIADAAHQSGIRGFVANSIIDVPMPWAKTVDECFDQAVALIDYTQDLPLIKATISPHSPYATKRTHLERCLRISQEKNTLVHIHLGETAEEVEQIKTLYHMRPTQYLNDIGLMNDKLLAVHMTQANNQDRDLCLKTGAHIVHCPESNMKLASGSCPAQMMIDSGINVALGTDGAASNNDLDMFGEMKSAAFMAKLIDKNPESLSANTVLCMATKNGAKALGLENTVGSLQVGFDADFIAVDLNRVKTIPVYHPISQLVYAASAEQVTDVWVQGRQLLKNRKLLTIDEDKLKADVSAWHSKSY